ncbi:MAG: xanthine dehydrogenase family protein molybdopterin-binding subunit [Ruegeria sp.]|uniref:xanthine dehydrogenase family protein molybdopterin-binding subunit n=1 Tax=Ruegeria sp. TaxID=1879320 RepID=UPI00349EE307
MRDAPQAHIGRPIRRREDPRLLRGEGCFVDDIQLSGALHLAFLRSPLPRGRIVECDVKDAAELPGIVSIFRMEDLGRMDALNVNPILPLQLEPPYPLLAAERVEAVGQPVAAVLAETAEQAQDAVEAIWLDIDEDDISLDQPAAGQSWTSGDTEAAFAQAAHVVSVDLHHPRLAPSPLEPRAIAVAPKDDVLTVWLSTQTPHRARSELARILNLSPERLRVIAPDVGGAFGMKASLYPEEVVAVWAARRLQRPVRWTATRSEDFLSATHGRGLRMRGDLAVDGTGRFLGLRAEAAAPLGHWLPNSALIPAWNAARILPGGYRVDAVEVSTIARMDNTAPVGIYRGAGRPEACTLMERLVDKAARATGLDPAEIRRRNLLPPETLPCGTPTGYRLDSGRYAEALDRLLASADYAPLLAERKKRRAEGKLFGLGLAFYVEPSGTGWESARVTLTESGAVVATGGSTQGHGRETALAQVAADTLGLNPEQVTVRHGDTESCPPGIGALASRSTPIGASAVQAACAEILSRRVKGEALPLTAELRYDAPHEAWGYGCYLAAMSIDRETGAPTVHHVSCMDDAGRLINPMMVEGQIRGGFAQGFGEAMMEALHYEDGQLLTGSLMDYALPRAADLPPLAIHKMETPTDANALGTKGVGEAGTIGAPAALLNAAIDALSPLGVTDLQMPLTSLPLWQAIRAAETEK